MQTTLLFYILRARLWWPIVANFNLNHRRNFKPHLNFVLGMKIKSRFTFQIDMQNQTDFYFYLHFVFRLLSQLNSHFINQV